MAAERRVLLFEPREARFLARRLDESDRLLRVLEARRGRHLLAAVLAPDRWERLQQDPRIASLRSFPMDASDAVLEPSGSIRLRRQGGLPVELRVLGPCALDDSSGARSTSACPASYDVVRPLSNPSLELGGTWRAQRLERPLAPSAVWITPAVVDAFLAELEHDASTPWERLRVRSTAAGLLVEPAREVQTCRPGRRGLRAWTLRGGATVWVECDVELPSILRRAPPPPGDYLVQVIHGEARMTLIEGEPSLASSLWSWPIREVEAIDVPVHRRSRSQEERDIEGRERGDPRSSETAAMVSQWLAEARDALPAADEDIETEVETVESKDADRIARETTRRGGWLRRFAERALPEPLRRRLDSESRQAIQSESGKLEMVRRETALLGSLLSMLQGEEWRSGLRLALPLRAPSDKEASSRWLNTRPALGGGALEFSLDKLAGRGELGAVGVGPEIWLQLRKLYRELGRRLADQRSFRAAAHVFSYLLGEHGRGAALLEAGSHTREAATVWYHLAGEPRRAAAALERGGLSSEAARIWMDASEWRRAAVAWQRAGDPVQARAAWRKLASDLLDAERWMEAAEVLDRWLGEGRAALEAYETCVVRQGRTWRECLVRALSLAERLGDRLRREEFVEDTLVRYHQVAATEGRRGPISRLFVLTLTLVEIVSRRADTRSSQLDREAGAALRAWRWSAELWELARRQFPQTTREELDEHLLASARSVASWRRDPCLMPDVRRWLSAAIDAPRTNIADAQARELGIDVVSYAHDGTAAHVGTRDGRVSRLTDAGIVSGEYDTGTGQPVLQLEAHDGDVWAAIDREVHHFREGAPTGTGALQTERSLPGSVFRLCVSPEGSALLRMSTRELHLLHPVHVRPLRRLLETGEHRLVDATIGRRNIAVLVARRSKPGKVEGHEVIVLERTSRQDAKEVREVERFEVHARRPRRLSFVDPGGDDALFLVGDEMLTWLPTMRSGARVFELEVSSRNGRVPPARVAYLRREHAVLLAYGDGVVETIGLEDGRRRRLHVEPDRAAGNLVGLRVDDHLRRIDLVFESGRLRSLALERAESRDAVPKGTGE